MSQIINESTTVVQIDSSGLQGGKTIYVSSTSVPGQLVTILDVTGFLSSPQTILLSTVGTTFSDGSYSTLLTQRFSYLTMVSQPQNTWSAVSASPFPDPAADALYKGLDAKALTSQRVTTTGFVSSGTLTTQGTVSQSTMTAAALMTSTLYVNSLPRFLAASPADYRFTVNGMEHIYGSTTAIGAGSFRGSISTGGDFFNTGNISSKFGTIYVGGDVTTASSIRGQRGIQMAVAAMNIFTSTSFTGPIYITSSVACGQILTAKAITTKTTTGLSINVMSSIQFTPTQSIQNRNGFFEFIGMPITVPGVSSSWLTASNSLNTSNLTLQSFGPASTLTTFNMSSAQITNPSGSLSISSIAGNTLNNYAINTSKMNDTTTLGVNYITMNDQTAGTPFSIAYPGGVQLVSSFWMISSLGQNGTLYAPLTTISTNTLVANKINATTLNTENDNLRNFYAQAVTARDNVMFSSVNSVSMKGVAINNSGGSIIGSRTETIQSVYCSSMTTDEISTNGAIRFKGANIFSLPVSYISSLIAGSITTSSFTVSQVTAGIPEEYSTINPSTPWLLISSFQMNTDPFTATKGLGTYFNEVSFIAAGNQTAYYSLIDPRSQTPAYLSSPYVNTVAGTGSPGTVSTNAQVAIKSQIGRIIGQPASDATHNLYIGANNNGWRLQRLTPTGTLTTLAGNYQYFYGDGKFPLNAALGPRLSVSIPSPGTLLITDISNVRLRFVTNDPIITTVAGTGASAYSGDGGLAFNATFSTPTATATDSLGRTFIADTLSQAIRVIVGSTIVTYGGTGVAGRTGDGGPATAATLNSPFGLTVDSANNVIFTDLSNSVIRLITPANTIALIGGNYTQGFSGDGGPATSAKLSVPRGITVDSANNIYFCDTGNARVRRIDAVSQIITTVAGNGVSAFGGDGGLAINANLSSPTGVAADSAGNIYIADTNNQCIRYVNMTSGTINTVAGRPRIQGYGGDRSFATFALLNSPSHMAFDPSVGYYYFADDGNSRIRYVNAATKIIFSAAGNGSPFTGGDGGPAINAVFGSITSVAVDPSQNIYVSDGLGHAIRRIDAVTSTITTVVGTGVGGFSGDGLLGTLAKVSSPQTVVTDLSANLYFTDTNNQRVRRWDSKTSTVSTLAGTGIAGYNGDLISSVNAQLNFPKALARDSLGALYVGDTANFRVRRLDPSGFITTYAGTGVQGIPAASTSFTTVTLGVTNALTTDATNQLYMADSTTNALWLFRANTSTLQPLSALSTAAYLGDAAPFNTAYFNQPTGLITDTCGNLVIADSGNYRLRRTYNFGNPLLPSYVNMTFKYENYFTSTGTAYIALNGNLLTTFYGSTMQNDSYTLTDANLLNYPLQTSNPVYGNQVPFIEITQTNTFGYSKLSGNVWIDEVPGQGFLQNSVDSNNGIIMNSGTLVFPYQNNGITIDNKYNDASLRTVNYTGSLISASDPALKENIQHANMAMCYMTLASLSLRRYQYSEPYISTFHVQDRNRLGFLTREVADILPNSVTPSGTLLPWNASSFDTLDLTQIKMSQFGVTKSLMKLVEYLEQEVSTVSNLLAQRNNVL